MSAPLRAPALVDALVEGGVSHLVGLPDNGSAALLARARELGAPRYVPVTREGEAFALASGLWLGGETPSVVIQNTGLLESGDALRGTAVRMGVPLVALVTWRGWAKLERLDALPRPGAYERDDLVRADVDSVAVLTTATLDAWGVPWSVCGDADALASLGAAFDRARSEGRPVVVLLPKGVAP